MRREKRTQRCQAYHLIRTASANRRRRETSPTFMLASLLRKPREAVCGVLREGGRTEARGELYTPDIRSTPERFSCTNWGTERRRGAEVRQTLMWRKTPRSGKLM